jgi:hypothetical protein
VKQCGTFFCCQIFFLPGSVSEKARGMRSKICLSEKLFLTVVSFPAIALKLCNPHHPIEIVQGYGNFSRAFHKLINTCVQNLIRNKYFFLQFGDVRATNAPASGAQSSLTAAIRGCYISCCWSSYG